MNDHRRLANLVGGFDVHRGPSFVGLEVHPPKLHSAFYYFLLLFTVFNVVCDWKPLATAGMKREGKPNVFR